MLFIVIKAAATLELFNYFKRYTSSKKKNVHKNVCKDILPFMDFL